MTTDATDRSSIVASLFDRLADGVYTLAYRILWDMHLAEDVVQETFLTALRRLDTFRGDGSLEGWLYRIGYRTAISTLRRRRDTPVDPAELPEPERTHDEGPERHVIVDELARRIDDGIRTLDSTLRSAFVLRDVEGLSTRETALALGISESAVKMRLARARQQLRAALQDYL